MMPLSTQRALESLAVVETIMKMKNLVRAFLFFAVFALLASSARATFDMFLKIEGPVIEGESTTPGYTNQMQLFSYSQGIYNPSSSDTNGVHSGRASVSSLNVMKTLDKGSPLLLFNSNQGTRIGKVTLSLVSAGASGGLICTVYMEDVLIESVQHSGSSGGDDRPTESVSFACSRIRWTYYPTPGSQAGKVESGWNYATNVPF